MNKIKRLYLALYHFRIKVVRFISNDKYKKISLKYFEKLGVVFNGKPKYINYDVNFDLTKPNMIYVGAGTVITKGCIILTHDYSIECGLVSIKKNNVDYESQFLREVHIGENVFVGYNSIILPGSIIEDNVIIGAGSVVRGKLEKNSIYIGNPAKKIDDIYEWSEKNYRNKYYVRGTKNKNI